jgi:hypothetical protein
MKKYMMSRQSKTPIKFLNSRLQKRININMKNSYHNKAIDAADHDMFSSIETSQDPSPFNKNLQNVKVNNVLDLEK